MGSGDGFERGDPARAGDSLVMMVESKAMSKLSIKAWKPGPSPCPSGPCGFQKWEGAVVWGFERKMPRGTCSQIKTHWCEREQVARSGLHGGMS